LAFLAEIEAANYWTVPAWRESNTTMDGAMWMIEGRRGSTYRVVSRSNFPDPALNHLVYALFQIANIAPPEGVLRPNIP
jgi:hypothetical protein